jgi:predicted acylesterase/phospholipase RssA
MALLRSALAANDLLGNLDTEVCERVLPKLKRVTLGGGQLLFRQGDLGDCLYIVVQGRLRVTVERDGAEELIGEVGGHETVGEMALLTHETRSATVRAARDSVLYKLSAEDFDKLLEQHPGIMIRLAKSIITRYTSLMRSSAPASPPSTIGVVPAGDDSPLAAVCDRIERALSAYGSVARINSLVLDSVFGSRGSQFPPGHPRADAVVAWLNEQEFLHQFVIYEADLSPTEWSRRCVRQADRLLVVVPADGSPTPEPVENDLPGKGDDLSRIQKELLLIHREKKSVYTGTADWLAKRQASAHHHVALNSAADFDRLARFLTGHATGLVLGGGGARAFAHIGVLRALQEARIPVDIIGGTSMGAFISAQWALGWGHEKMRIYNRATWRRVKPMQDYTLPIISLLAGRRFWSLAQEICGDSSIEDLDTRFFCVSSNLTRAAVQVHQRGSLARSIMASTSVPGLLPPVRDRSNLLVDGAILDNLPVGAMRLICGGTIIASSVSPGQDLAIDPKHLMPETVWSAWRYLRGKKEGLQRPPTIVDILSRVSTLSSTIVEQSTRAHVALFLQLPTATFTVVDWKRVDDIINAGYVYATRAIKNWRPESESRLAQAV